MTDRQRPIHRRLIETDSGAVRKRVWEREGERERDRERQTDK